MNQSPIPFPPRTGLIGADVFGVAVAIVKNRTGQDYTAVFNRFHTDNGDLMEPGYDGCCAAPNFSWLLNRVASANGLCAVAATERAASDIATLTRWFAPSLLVYPVAVQWDALWRTALALDGAGVPERLCNRAAESSLSKADFKEADQRAAAVFSMLDGEATDPFDRGPMLEQLNPARTRDSFRLEIDRLMSEKDITRRQAFDRIKEAEPIFFALAMLTFEP